MRKDLIFDLVYEKINLNLGFGEKLYQINSKDDLCELLKESK